MEWLQDVPDGDPVALARVITTEHPGYAAHPLVTKAEIQSRIAALSRSHRGDEPRARGHRVTQDRIAELQASAPYRVRILKLVIPAKAGIHLGHVNMDSRVRGNDERASSQRARRFLPMHGSAPLGREAR
jgi:hypothetical protein